MLDIAGALLDALAEGHRVAVATVTRVLGSAPRTRGTARAVTDAGAVIGSPGSRWWSRERAPA